MKTIIVIMFLAIITSLFNYCNVARNSNTKSKNVLVTYFEDINSIILNNCSPCHLPTKGGRSKAYNSYSSVKPDIDEIIRRIELDTTNAKFMPRKRQKLSDSLINTFKKWKSDGLHDTRL